MSLTPVEAEAVSDAYHEASQQRTRDAWERMRMLATISIQLNMKKRIRSEDIMPFPWDAEHKTDTENPKAETLTKEEAKERLRGLIARAKGTSNDPEG